MTAVETGYRHIQLDERGVPLIGGTRFNVALLIEQMRAYGWDTDEARSQHPELTLAQIHSALAYYYDHQAAIDGYLERALHEYEAARSQAGPSTLRARLKARLGATGQR